jgi:cystathionine beta-lyase
MTASGFNPDALDRVTAGELRATGSRRWADARDGEIAASLAEMDLGVAPVIRERVNAVQRYGYVTPTELARVSASCSAWLAAEWSWLVDPERIAVIPDVVSAVEQLIQLQTQPDDVIAVTVPSYAPLAAAARRVGRRVLEVPLATSGQLDLGEIEQALRRGARLVILCNPLNPTGTVFDSAGLAQLAQLVELHGARVLSDEVHAPLTRRAHRPYASFPGASAHTTTIVSASKTWNLSGLKCAQLVFSNPEERGQWRRAVPRLEGSVSVLGAVATTAAYGFGEPWRRDLLDYLGRSDALLVAAGHPLPQASYFSWLRLAENVTVDDLRRDGRVIAADGAFYGAPGWIRLTLATPTPIVAQMLERISPFLRHRC